VINRIASGESMDTKRGAALMPLDVVSEAPIAKSLHQIRRAQITQNESKTGHTAKFGAMLGAESCAPPSVPYFLAMQT
jgi:hypothetical protein